MKESANPKFKFTKMNLPLIFIAVLLTCAGVVMVFSSQYTSILIEANNEGEPADIMSNVYQQGAVGILFLAFMIFMGAIDYHFYIKPSMVLSALGLAIVLLALVWTGPAVRGVHRWVGVGGKTFQSSEFAKIACVIYTTSIVHNKKNWQKNIGIWAALLLPVGLMAILIVKEPDLSTTICFMCIFIAILFVAGANWQGMILLCALALGVFAVKLLSEDNYHVGRFSSWLHAWDDPSDSGFQVVQSLYAIGDGGVLGVGIGNSKQKINNLPMADSDYIFSIICEEFGLWGGTLIVVLFAAYVFCGIKIAIEADDLTGKCLASGVTVMVGVQSFFNMAVATNVIPSTGLTLPFISKGASSLICTLMATGILLSVSCHKEVVKQEARDEAALQEIIKRRKTKKRK